MRAVSDANDHGGEDDIVVDTNITPNPEAGVYGLGASEFADPPTEILREYDEGTGNPTAADPQCDLYSRDDPFSTYLMWRPSTLDSIWVPVWVVNWNWSFFARSADGGATWTVDSSHSTYGIGGEPEEAGYATDTAPERTTNMSYHVHEWVWI